MKTLLLLAALALLSPPTFAQQPGCTPSSGRFCTGPITRFTATSTPPDHHSASGDIWCAPRGAFTSSATRSDIPITFQGRSAFYGGILFQIVQNPDLSYSTSTLTAGTDFVFTQNVSGSIVSGDTDWCCSAYDTNSSSPTYGKCVSATASITLPTLTGGQTRVAIYAQEPFQWWL